MDVRTLPDNELGCYSSYMEVDLGIVRQNAQTIMKALAPHRKLMPVIKGNTWGTGTIPLARVMVEDLGIDTISCAQACEAIAIRNAGMKDVEILLLSGVPFHALRYAVEYNLQVPVYNMETARILSDEVRRQGKVSHKIQIKVDTGMHRIGVAPGDLEALIDGILSLGNLEIVGIYTHYYQAYYRNSPSALMQYGRFVPCVELLRSKGIDPQYIHTCNSGAAVWMDDTISNYARVGCMVVCDYGLSDHTPGFGTKQPFSWRAFITALYNIPAGEPVGYGGSNVSDVPRRTATISAGFCDGLYLPMGHGKAPLLVNGQYAKYINIAMDQTMIDVTGIDCKLGDEVTIMGRDKHSGLFLRTEDMAPLIDGEATILHAYASPRVKRIYVDSQLGTPAIF